MFLAPGVDFRGRPIPAGLTEIGTDQPYTKTKKSHSKSVSEVSFNLSTGRGNILKKDDLINYRESLQNLLARFSSRFHKRFYTFQNH